MRGAGLRFLFFVHHREASSNSPALEKRTLPELFVWKLSAAIAQRLMSLPSPCCQRVQKCFC